MMRKLSRFLSPARVISFGFAFAIFIGSILLMLPISIRDGVYLSYIDALYTSTSAVCVTGLIAVDAADTFTAFGQLILGVLIQIGGLGVTMVGAGVILAMGKRINLGGRNIIKEASNLSGNGGAVRFVKSVLIYTLIFELVGAILSFIVFIGDYPPVKAIGISLFHSVAAFNNSGFDILGGLRNMIPYRDDVLLNIVTMALIFFGGIGFLVIRECLEKRLKLKKLSMHSKVVLCVSFFLIITGALLLKLSEDITWLGAFFHSVSARTAGFSSYSLGNFSPAGLFLIIVLMFIGASPGSTGGGIKTSTFFVLLLGIRSAATNKGEKAFKYSLPRDAFKKAAIICILALFIVIAGSYIMLVLEPHVDFMDALFEMTSAFGTVGLSTGITTSLGLGGKILSIIMMYIGRLGPLTVATLWYFSAPERTQYAEGNIAIG